MIRWGMLGAGDIGRTVLPAVAGSAVAEFAAVAARDGARATAYAAEFGVPVGYGSYDDLLADDAVDAVYVALPVSLHAEWSIKALQAGKHVLCEKPFTVTAAEAVAVAAAARAANRYCVEGFMWRLHPRTLLARQLVADGVIGALTLVRAALSITAPAGDIRRNLALGGGALGDLGGYCVSAARLFGGFPESVYAAALLEGDGLDRRLAATLRFPSGALAQFDVGLDLPRRDELVVIGTGGSLTLPDPWIVRSAAVELRRTDPASDRTPEPEVLTAAGDEPVYRVEFDRVSAAISAGAPAPYGTEDAVAQMVVMDALRESAHRGEPVRPEQPA